MSTFRAIVFDLDGTLIHSAPDLHAAANVALIAEGRPTLDLETITSFIGDGVEKLIERCLAATGGVSDLNRSSALSKFLSAYSADMTTLTRIYPGADDCLQRLRDADVPLAICTNKPGKPAKAICNALDLARYFDLISGAEAGIPKKPDPAPLLDVVARLDISPSEVLYVGDTLVDYQTSQNADIAFRLFSGGYLNSPIAGLTAAQIFDHWSGSGLAPMPSGTVTIV